MKTSIRDMETLLSVPPALASHFDGLSGHFEQELFVTNDPSGTKLGSGDGTGFCAIQCKYYQPDHEITKTDIDSFISASTSEVFVYRMLIDTSYKDNHLAVRIASA